MKKFKEKKSVIVLHTIGAIFVIAFLISLFLSMINTGFLWGMFTLLFALLFIVIGNSLSEKCKYSSEFIEYMNKMDAEAVTLSDLIQMKNVFEHLAIKDGMYDLKYPTDLRNIHARILNKIEILRKQAK